MIDVAQLERDAVEIYGHASARAELVRGAWEAAGRPVTVQGARGGLRIHPLLDAVQAAEKHCARLRVLLRPARMGRPPVAIIEPPRPRRLSAVPNGAHREGGAA